MKTIVQKKLQINANVQDIQGNGLEIRYRGMKIGIKYLP